MMIFAWLEKRKARKAAAAGLYQSIVAQSRNPVFFTRMGVPDTMDGRFDLLTLHASLVLMRLRTLGSDGAKLSQAVFDQLLLSLEEALREAGIGDVGVPKHMRKMVKAFNGRVHAYEAALAQGGDAVVSSLVRNVYRGSDSGPASHELAAYTVAMHDAVGRQALEEFAEGRIAFPAAEQFSAEVYHAQAV
ncbi:MAG: ubiquinol-cytochrome C chaperone [Micavibrio aeruginosavorus]|uniref:Ubiquinol-cytochrome C chaperone n=1 Tax=Micavibrio aeruginosavorus TaxID=349221 RepID=A0A2W5BVC5_9BACT|nr:MAG: ubiquinol-cytochrome C chaperone [Micavibrio aeruginosavorus]